RHTRSTRDWSSDVCSSDLDDVMALPLMAVGGRGLISVVSNEAPGEVAQMIEAAEREDFAAARAIHHRLMPLMLANFVEANPVPRSEERRVGSEGRARRTRE